MASKRELIQRWQKEPGLSIRQRILDFLMDLDLNPGHGKKGTQQVFQMLEGLPFREEVTNGRDLRGSDFGGGYELDFSDCDFSFASACRFINCDLSRSRFDHASEGIDFRNIVNNASFRGADLRSACFMNSQARECCFDKARLKRARFQDADLTGSTFFGADCYGAAFGGAKLKRCDMRHAILDMAVFADTLLDETTDIRGASLVNAFYDDYFDVSGNLVAHGVNLRLAKYDGTTKFGTDANAVPMEILDAALSILAEDPSPEARRIVDLLANAKERLGHEAWERLEEEIISKLSPSEKDAYEEVMDNTYRDLL